jgi:class 3 adenylate cyclase
MKTEAIQMHRFTLRFPDVLLEQAFHEEQGRNALQPFRTGMLCTAGVVLIIWLLLDSFLPQIPDARSSLSIPMLVILGFVIYGYVRSYFPYFLRNYQPLILCGALALAADLVWMGSLLPRSATEDVGIMVLVHTLNVYTIVRLRFPWACYGGWGIAAIYLGYLSYSESMIGFELARPASLLLITNLFGMITAYQMDKSARREFLATRDSAIEHERSERLLLNILPVELAQELSVTGSARPARHESVTVLFTDFSGFTQIASSMPAECMVAELNEIFAAFDDITDACGVEKIKTIGDAYMAAAGLPKPCADHAQRCVRAGLFMIDYLENRNRTGAFKWSLRVGVHSGPVVAGVVGKRKYAFDIWGDTVNVASRMESSGEIGRVNVSAYTFDLIRTEFDCTYRGRVDAKGKGQIDMYFVTGAQVV